MIAIFDLTFINTSILTSISNSGGKLENTFLLCIILSIVGLIPGWFINHNKVMQSIWAGYRNFPLNLLLLQGISFWVIVGICNYAVGHMLNSLIRKGSNKKSNINKVQFQLSCIMYLDILFMLMYTIQDLFILYCLLEIAIITILLPMISITGDKGAKNLALEYFIINLLVNFFGWMALIGLYGLISTLDIINMKINIMYFSSYLSEFSLIVLFFLIFLMVFIKLALAPFHSWALILYSKLSGYSFLLLMGPFKIIYWTLFLISFDIIWVNSNIFASFRSILFFCGCVIYFWGLLLTVQQLKIKSFFITGSSIYSGTFLIGISFIISWNSLFMISLYAYLSVYLIITFYVLILLIKQGGIIITFSDCNKYLNYKEKSLIILYFGFFLGLPPFISFLFKYLLTSYLIINAALTTPIIAYSIYLWYWFTLLPYLYYLWQLFIILVW